MNIEQLIIDAKHLLATLKAPSGDAMNIVNTVRAVAHKAGVLAAKDEQDFRQLTDRWVGWLGSIQLAPLPTSTDDGQPLAAPKTSPEPTAQVPETSAPPATVPPVAGTAAVSDNSTAPASPAGAGEATAAPAVESIVPTPPDAPTGSQVASKDVG